MVWTEEERKHYKQINCEWLDRIYSEAGISANDPEGRSRYLMDLLEIKHKVNSPDSDFLMEIKERGGNLKALKVLEYMVSIIN